MTALPDAVAQPGVMPAQPVPTHVSIGQVHGAQGTLVVLQIATPVGVAVYFLDPDGAIQVGQTLRQHGKASKAGLALPGEADRT